jgi:tRNA(Ile)-lysidine synthase
VDPAARFAAELRRLRALPPSLPEGPYLVALSGGSDSTALLLLAIEAGCSVRAAHLDHALRPDSDADALSVFELCRGLGVTLFSQRTDVAAVAAARGWSLEDTARRVRYDFLARVARQAGTAAILTGHTLDDDAETLLLQLLRGTARATGVPPRRGRVLRPLLAFRREELESFLDERNLDWLNDPSNRDTRFTRNWVRHDLLPRLEERFPGARTALARYARLSREEDAFLEQLVAHVPIEADWRREPLAIRRRLVRAALEEAGVPPDTAHVEDVIEALEAGAVRRLSLPSGATARTQVGRLTVWRGEAAKPDLDWPTGLDRTGLEGAEVRTRQAGDRIRLPGGTRKLSDVLIDRKVPREERDAITVIALANEVLWVGLDPPILSTALGNSPDEDATLMGEAITLAREAADAGEVPVGAVVARAGEVIGRGRNRSREGRDMTLHAELEALRQATTEAGAFLTGCTLYVTLEPCPMCLGAAIEARVERIVYGAENVKAGALGGVSDLLRAPWTHLPIVRRNLRAKECAGLLSDFFGNLRSEQA